MIEKIAAQIKARLGACSPETAVILGSGLGALGDLVENPIIIPYAEIEGFPQSTVSGHKGRLIIGRLEGKDILCMQGRVHLYEGHSPQSINTFIKAFQLLGIKNLIVTNASGSLTADLPAGTIMLISDHINLSGANPLIGPNDDAFGPRFPDMSNAYDAELRTRARQIAARENVPLAEGVYLMVSGPTFDTPAEVRAYRILGCRRRRHVHCSRSYLRRSFRHEGSRFFGHRQSGLRPETRRVKPCRNPARSRKGLRKPCPLSQNLYSGDLAMDDVTAAKHLVRLLDLTSLNNDDTESRIEKLCAKAQTPYGNVAAVCIYPKFLPLAKSLLDGTSVKLATVVNFPDGGSDLSKVRAETEYALEKGAVEIDAVFPYRNFLAGDYQTCADFVALISKITGKKHPSKIILETGVIEKAALIARAAGICIDNGANFIKTSTGKTPVSATPEAANVILETVASGRRNVGFKASGGIKTIDDAKKYLVLANAIMGWKWISPSNFRIGASSLLDNLIEVIERGY